MYIPPLTFFDIETTGFEPIKNVGLPLYHQIKLEPWHTIAELGWITVRQKNEKDSTDWLIIQRANFLIDVEERYLNISSEEALNLNGYLKRKEKYKHCLLSLRDALWRFINQCADSILVAKNPCFDAGFMKVALAQANIPFKEFQRRFHHCVLDVNSIVLGKILSSGIPISPYVIDKLPEILGISPEPKSHTAQTGAEYAFKLYRQVINLNPNQLRRARSLAIKFLKETPP